MKFAAPQGLLPTLAPTDLCIFVGCDAGYARAYAMPLVRSIGRNAPDRPVHLHIVNPDDRLETELSALAAERTGAALTWTIERTDLQGLNAAARAVYYACVRFIRAYQVMSAAPARYLVLDADSIVRRPIVVPDDCDAGLYLRPDNPDHMKIAAGAVLLCPTAAGAEFAGSVARSLAKHLPKAVKSVGWFLDQIVIESARRRLAGRGANIHDFSQDRLIDWEFGPQSQIWTGKGPRKHGNSTFVREVEKYREPALPDPWAGQGQRILILRPFMDLPFKRPPLGQRRPLDRQTAALRTYWTRMADTLQTAFEARGHGVVVLDRPMWEFTPELVNRYRPDLVLVPHRRAKQFAGLECPALYYMQMYARHLFTVDPEGWGGEASRYPANFTTGDPRSDAWDVLAGLKGANASKFDQPTAVGMEALVVPRAPFIFFPCQIPHDETILFDSDHGEADVLAALVRWCEARKVPLVLKEHPANRASMTALRLIAPASDHVHWIEASIHDLIGAAKAVYTINSGVGLEAMVHGKPVVAFGRTMYDAAVRRAETLDMEALDGHWRAVQGGDHLQAYRRFIDWFVRDCAVDLDDTERLGPRMDRLVGQAERLMRKEIAA